MWDTCPTISYNMTQTQKKKIGIRTEKTIRQDPINTSPKLDEKLRVKVSSDLLAKTKARAIKEHLKLSDIIRKALWAYVEPAN